MEFLFAFLITTDFTLGGYSEVDIFVYREKCSGNYAKFGIRWKYSQMSRETRNQSSLSSLLIFPDTPEIFEPLPSNFEFERRETAIMHPRSTEINC